MTNFDGFSSDLSLTLLRFVWFEKSHNMLSLREGEGRVALHPGSCGRMARQDHPVFTCICVSIFIYCVEWNVPHGFFSSRICGKLFSEISMFANHEWPKSGQPLFRVDFFRNLLVWNHLPGMWLQLHQQFELRQASDLDSWKAVPSPTFQLDLGPGYFTNGFGLKGVRHCTLKAFICI